jgi:hypothetical protein
MADRAYSYEALGAMKSRILSICVQVRQENPQAWRDAHNGNFDETSTRYNDLCVQALRADGIFAGCNGKRGGDQRSDDVLAFGLTDDRGARDTSGRFPSIAIIDYIGRAGDPDVSARSITWGDVSHVAPGKFLDPQGLARIDGGGTSAPDPTPTPTPTPPYPPPVPPPSQTPDESEVRFRVLDAKLDAVLVALDEAKQQQAADTDQLGKWMVEQAQGVVASVTGPIGGALESLTKWLRGRSALRF